MRRCGKCGNEYPDEFLFCPVDGVAFEAGGAEQAEPGEARPKLDLPGPAVISVRTLMIGLAGLIVIGVSAFAGAFFYLYLKPKYGSLEIKTTPPDAIIYLDGKQAGVSPLTLQNVRTGGHQIRATKEGYQEMLQTVQVAPYATDSVHWSLEPLVPQLSNEQLAAVEELKRKLESALKENILLPPPEDYNVLYFLKQILAIDPADAFAVDMRNKVVEGIQQRADLAYAKEDWLEAEKQYRSLALIYPDDVSIGERLTDIGAKIDESLKDRERRIQELTDKAEAALKAGNLLPPEEDNALDAIRSIQRLDRRSAYARGALVQLREALQTQGDSKMNSGDWIGARNQYRLVLQYFPDDSYSKSRLEQAEAKVVETARAEREDLARQQEEKQGQLEREDLHRAAISAFQAGDYAKSQKLWQDYLKREPDNAEAFFYLGAISLERKQLDTAILNFERCVAGNPRNALAHLNLGILYDHHRNDPVRAIEHFKIVLDLGGVDRYTPERLRSMIQEIQERMDLAALEKRVFAVEHKHVFSSCRGHLRVTAQGVEYRTAETDHSFYETWPRIRTWSVDGDEVSLKLENNKNYNFRLQNLGEANLIFKLFSQWARASR